MSTELWFHKTDKFHNIASKAAISTRLCVKEHGALPIAGVMGGAPEHSRNLGIQERGEA